ncbi:MAG: prepilin-type N-terminal cleavage/methylation domain-containing protein [Firmicutes bacterium]|nr:prepilin-type N-terminal cleavage/methylation domain-containing protein [Bacillota bacterium]
MRKLNRKGFTLVELMVVLAILGLLALVGIPQYTQVMERARIGRDLAQIATVQTVVTAFVTETDWLEKNKTRVPLFDDEEGKVSSIITANSYLTGGEVELEDFFEEGFKEPELESKTAQGGNWYIDADGTVYVENGKVRLPGDNNASGGK